MTWNLGLIEQFYRNHESDQAAYEQFVHEDPVGKMWKAYRDTEQAFHDAKAERAALGYGDSINPERSAELAEKMPVLLERRRKLLDGLQAAIIALGDQPQPDVRYFQTRIVGLRRGRGSSGEIAAFQGIIDSLEGIANSCFQ